GILSTYPASERSKHWAACQFLCVQSVTGMKDRTDEDCRSFTKSVAILLQDNPTAPPWRSDLTRELRRADAQLLTAHRCSGGCDPLRLVFRQAVPRGGLANGFRIVTPRQVKPLCMSSDSSQRHPEDAAAASMIPSQSANLCLTDNSIASMSTPEEVSATRLASCHKVTAVRTSRTGRCALRTSNVKSSASACAGITTSSTASSRKISVAAR